MGKTESKKEEKPVKIEKMAEDAGELIGKGMRKTWDAAKSFGQGLVDTANKREEQKTFTFSLSRLSSFTSSKFKFLSYLWKEAIISSSCLYDAT